MRGTGLLSAAQRSAALEVPPSSRTIGSCEIYDANDCPVCGLGFSTATAKVFIKGQDSEIHCAPAAQAGTRYLVVIQGLDVDQNNPFYATLDRP